MNEAVILAAGKGSRMKEYTEDNAKSMLLLKNKKPMLEEMIDRCKAIGIEKFIVIVNYRKEDIMDYFKNGEEFDVKINYVVQTNPKGGTADALKYARDQIEGDSFMMLYCDVLPSIEDLKRVKEGKYFEGDNVMAVRQVEDPTRYGVVEYKDYFEWKGLIRVVEKSLNPPSNLINSGVYILQKNVFDYLEKTTKSARGEYEFTDTINDMITDKNDWNIIFLEDEIIDIGTEEDYQNYLKSSKKCWKSDKSITNNYNVRFVLHYVSFALIVFVSVFMMIGLLMDKF